MQAILQNCLDGGESIWAAGWRTGELSSFRLVGESTSRAEQPSRVTSCAAERSIKPELDLYAISTQLRLDEEDRPDRIDLA